MIGLLEAITGGYFIFLVNAIRRDDLKLRTNLTKIFKSRDAYIALSFFLLSVVYILYEIKYGDISRDEKKSLTIAFKAALIAFITAIGGMVGLWVAPYFLTLMVFMHHDVL